MATELPTFDFGLGGDTKELSRRSQKKGKGVRKQEVAGAAAELNGNQSGAKVEVKDEKVDIKTLGAALVKVLEGWGRDQLGPYMTECIFQGPDFAYIRSWIGWALSTAPTEFTLVCVFGCMQGLRAGKYKLVAGKDRVGKALKKLSIRDSTTDPRGITIGRIFACAPQLEIHIKATLEIPTNQPYEGMTEEYHAMAWYTSVNLYNYIDSGDKAVIDHWLKWVKWFGGKVGTDFSGTLRQIEGQKKDFVSGNLAHVNKIRALMSLGEWS